MRLATRGQDFVYVHQSRQVLALEACGLGVQRQEASEEVWAAALGCLLHLTVAGGQPNKGLLLGLPMQALALLLRRCSDFGWCALMLLRLLLLSPDMSGPAQQMTEKQILDGRHAGSSCSSLSGWKPDSPAGCDVTVDPSLGPDTSGPAQLRQNGEGMTQLPG